MNFKKYMGTSPDVVRLTDPAQIKKRYNTSRWSVFWAATIGYGLYYVCRLSINVVKKPIVDAGVLSEGELGVIGAALFVTYAVGKLTNGFLADRSNIRRFLGIGLLVSAAINLILGFTTSFVVFVTLWGLNGWVQSMGAPPCVVGLSRWFSAGERGTFYGLWSSSHNIGEALTFIFTAFVVSVLGWQWGFRGAGLLGLAGVAVILTFMKDTPGSRGLPPVSVYKGEEPAVAEKETKSVGQYQKEVLRNPAIWLLAVSSAFMYISRYAVNSWGIFFLEAQKGYTNLEASSVISISSVCGIVGTMGCGWFSDRFFGGSRHLPAFIFGLMNVVGLSLLVFGPAGNFWLDATAMVIFGLAIGALICYLGGLMAVDIASEKASGAALGVVGIASYAGAALQDVISGFVIASGKNTGAAVTTYDFTTVVWFWVGSAVLSVLFALAVWRYSARRNLKK